MPVDRFYTKQPLTPKTTIEIDGAEFQHMTKVVRSKPRNEVELVNGKGQLASACIAAIEKKKAYLDILALHEHPPSSFHLTLAQAIPRMNRLDTIIEKATELGADEIQLFPGEKSERKTLTDHQLERLENITISAMKQCGRLYLPTIMLKPALKQWNNLQYPGYYGNPEAKQWLGNAWNAAPPNNGVIFFVGPESGFTDEENRLLDHLGAKGVLIHENVLRTDTAPLVALSLMHSLQQGRT